MSLSIIAANTTSLPIWRPAVSPWLAQATPGDGAATGMLGYDLSAVLVFALFGIVFVVVTVSILSRLLRPRALPEIEPAKSDTYECGEPTVGTSWVRFDIRFYTVALVFLIFDVEVAFLFPWAVIFKDLRLAGMGAFVFVEMLIFLGILLAGFIYCWKKGDLDWIKSLDAQRARARAAEIQAAESRATAEEKSPAAAS